MIVAALIGSSGGTWRHLRDLVLGLRAQGLEVNLALDPGAEQVHRAAAEVGLSWMPLRASLRADADIWHLHLHDTMERRAVQLIAARRLFGPVVVTEHLPHSHASDPLVAPYYPRHRFASTVKTGQKRGEYALATQVIAVSATSAEFLRRRYGLADEKLSLVRNGVAIPSLAPEPPDPAGRPLKVLALGTMIAQKGFDLLLDALTLTERESTLELIGSGHEFGELRGRAARFPDGRVSVHEWVDDPSAHIAAADVVCMPSRWESFPYTALEALIAARPLIGTRVDGLDEIVRDGSNGLLVDPESPSQIAAAIDRLAGDPASVTAMGAAAWRDAARYPLSAMIDGTIETYRRAVRRAGLQG